MVAFSVMVNVDRRSAAEVSGPPDHGALIVAPFQHQGSLRNQLDR
jgi:hypothetical protein